MAPFPDSHADVHPGRGLCLFGTVGVNGSLQCRKFGAHTRLTASSAYGTVSALRLGMNTLLNFPPPCEVIFYSIFPDVTPHWPSDVPEHIDGGETERLPLESMNTLVFG